MTTIKSIFGKSLTIEPSKTLPDHHAIKLEGAEGTKLFPTSDLLAALDAVPAEKLAQVERERDEHYAALNEVEPKLLDHDTNPWKARWQTHECELAEANRRLAAVEAELDNADADALTVKMYNRLKAALNPRPAFELPTTAGAGVRAAAVAGGVTDEFRLYGDGLWRGINWDAPRTREELLSDFVDHRLIGADE